ncbi:MAG: hypothetical protein H6511_04565 [Holophagales bacterium]|nr:hypothetical protein [Holophagales bacterium]
MADHSKPVVYTELEIRSYLPSGWGIHDARSGRWDAKEASWGVDVYDGADNVWKLEVAGADAAKAGRLEALKASIDKIERKALGRKSVITG